LPKVGGVVSQVPNLLIEVQEVDDVNLIQLLGGNKCNFYLLFGNKIPTNYPYFS